MAAIVCVCGQKGGTGKSTVATCVASELVARGRRVLLVDADPQASSAGLVAMAREQQRSAPTLLIMGAQMHSSEQLAKVAAAYDLTVIDCPPAIGEIQASALMVSTLALLPCGPSTFEAWALKGSLDLVGEAQRVRRRLRVAVVINKRKVGTDIGKGARAVLSATGVHVLASELGDRVVYQEAPAAGLGAAQYEPTGDAATEVRALTDELLHLLGDRKHGQEKAEHHRPKPRRRG